MAIYGKERTEYLKERIRALMTIVPRATNVGIQRALESDQDDPIRLDVEYISKLVGKIRRDRKFRFVGEQAEQALAEFQDKKNAIVEQMWKILLNPTAKDDIRISAARTIMEAEDRYLSKQMDAGIFERNLGTVKFKASITEERRVLIVQAFKNFGIVKGELLQELQKENANAKRITTNS